MFIGKKTAGTVLTRSERYFQHECQQFDYLLDERLLQSRDKPGFSWIKKGHCWESLKQSITLYFLLISLSPSLGGKAKTISNKRENETTTPFINFSSVFNIQVCSFFIIEHMKLFRWENREKKNGVIQIPVRSCEHNSWKHNNRLSTECLILFTIFPLTSAQGAYKIEKWYCLLYLLSSTPCCISDKEWNTKIYSETE